MPSFSKNDQKPVTFCIWCSSTQEFTIHFKLKTKIMSTVAANYAGNTGATATTTSAVDRVITILKLTFGLVPIVAGADKFTDLLVNWDQYLAPAVASKLPLEVHSFMIIVGIIEIVAGLLVLIRPRLGSIIVCAWLICIALNLLLTGQYYDVAVRDIVMSIGAFSLFTLTGGKKE
jgi:uncharacterized membrane protein YphA (DoxX/SURF4 family)